MNRIFRSLNGHQRRNFLLFNAAFGSSTLLAYSLWSSELRRPVLAEGGPFGLQWKKPALVSSEVKSTPKLDDQTTSDRSKDQPEEAKHQGETRRGNEASSSDSQAATNDDEYMETWQNVTSSVSAVTKSLLNFNPGGIRDKVLPDWVRLLPTWLDKIQNEMSMAPWSLSWEIWEDAHNPEAHPETIWNAKVRISNELCIEEQQFLAKRRQHTKKALAAYLGVPESDVEPEDVPVIAMCGSGGGLRALVAGASSYLSAAEDGLFDCVTYTAGVSGSCWLQALYYTSIGQQNYGNIIKHLKDRLGIHIAEPAALLKLVSEAPTNKYLLSGYVEKLRGVPDADFGLVDIYGLALAARLLVPRGDLRINDTDLKISNQRRLVDQGHLPLPIYTAVRHEIPEPEKDLHDQANSSRFNVKQSDWFQWFEWTPYELFSEDLQAGIPSWAVGRKWEAGRTVWNQNGFTLPEMRIPLYLGIWGSAFCATLSHYYKEIRPIILAAGMGGLDSLVSERDEDMVKVHPIDPAVVPNYTLGLREYLPSSCPKSIHTAPHLQLMDAGMANNLPIYPLLRPGRDVDIVIAFDASADVRNDNWIKVVDNYVAQRGIKGWPMGAGWPPQSNTEEQTVHELEVAQATAEKKEGDGIAAGQKIRKPSDLGHCTVWLGSTREQDEFMDHGEPRRIETEDDHSNLQAADAGIAVIYFPLLPNKKISGVDPMTSDFMSTWNFIYKPEQIDDVVALARANFEEGKDQTKRTIRAVWERKRAARLEQAEESARRSRESRVRKGGAALRRNGDVGQGDQFGGI